MKINLGEAAQRLEQLCEQIETLEEVNEGIQFLFEHETENLKEAVDRRIRYFLYLDGAIQKAKEMQSAWKNRISILEATRARIEENTKLILQGAPNLRYGGDLGELQIQANGGKPKLQLHGPYENARDKFLTVDDPLIDTVDHSFLQSGYRLDTELIRKALEIGSMLPFANLVRGNHVRIKI
jgi:hypothetical protein